MSRRGPRAGALRIAALAGTSLVLLGSVDYFPPEEDSASFDSATSCGAAGVVTLSTEAKPRGCAPRGYDLVHVRGGPEAGLPELGELDYGTYVVTSPGDVLLDARIVLVGPVSLLGAVPATTVERRCRLAREAPGVLGVACEGPDPEAACTGTLTLRAVAP